MYTITGEREAREWQPTVSYYKRRRGHFMAVHESSTRWDVRIKGNSSGRESHHKP
jgi:hypothetical protein